MPLVLATHPQCSSANTEQRLKPPGMSAGSYFIPLERSLCAAGCWLLYFIVDSYPFEHNIVEKAGQVRLGGAGPSQTKK